MSQLTRLQRLKLGGYFLSPSSLSQLSALASSLTRLELCFTEMPTAALAALTRLQHWKFETSDEGAALDVASALPHLTGLTCLVSGASGDSVGFGIDGEGWGVLDFDLAGAHPCNACPCLHESKAARLQMHDPLPFPLPALLQVLKATRKLRPMQLPPTLSSLSQLRVCYLQGCRSTTAAGKAPLPGGPWLHSLECLAASVDTLLASTAVLRQATRLERLGLLGSFVAAVDWHSPAAAALFEWLAAHPPLRCLSIMHDDWGNAAVFQADAFRTYAEQLRRRRPARPVRFPALGWEGETLGARMYGDPF